jgi:hypothetical protein
MTSLENGIRAPAVNLFEARHAVKGHNVSLVLAFSLTGVILASLLVAAFFELL